MSEAPSKVANFLESLSFSSLPDAVTHQLKRAVLDAVGCLISGLDTPFGQALVKLADRFPDAKGATALGFGPGVSPPMAATINGYLGNVLDFDDGHRASGLHTGTIYTAAALAAAQERDCTGQTFMEAMAGGYEIGLRAGRASRFGQVYYGSAYGGTFGAAAAAAWILGLSPTEILNALGVAEMQAPNSMLMGWVKARNCPMVKEGMGWAAGSALTSVYMGQAGISGALTVFDGREELANLATLGRDFELTRLYFKPYPGCRWIHGPLDALFDILKETGWTRDQVTKIEVKTFSKAAALDIARPPSLEDAEYSMPFALGATLAEGAYGAAQLSLERLADPVIHTQADKVAVIRDAYRDAIYPEQVTSQTLVHGPGGQIVSRERNKIPGDWEVPLSDKFLTNKFLTLAQRRLDPAQALADKLWHLDQQPSLAGLMAELDHLTRQ